MRDLSSEIKKIGLDIGFNKIGITAAIQPSKSKNLEIWLNKGFSGTMEWMVSHQEKRMNIHNFFPGAKSVICVAHNYYTPFHHSNKREIGKISRYACGEDYHKIMKKKLKTYLQEINKLDPGLKGRLCVDTAPMMEKLWAEQAGLGWQGKHTNLITRDYGSWVFLGEIVIDKELNYDVQIEDLCGSCQACLDACPTNAIVEPYVLDAQKCISYLTIEYWNKPIDNDLKKNMNGWIFGCDICQDVCPWNKFKQNSSENRYWPREDTMEFDLDELEKLDEISYKKKFKKSPVLRPGWKNFRRNVRAVKKIK
ncbi:MAG: tRNA epoxyqueuosine(34) reductase QueG [Calditrichia bacterium]|nr:tRNA epoxyqueuosine(34) reductase QueG [Calditrichia bacterium]